MGKLFAMTPKLRSLLAYLLIVPCAAGLALTDGLFGAGPWIALQLAGVALMLWARLTFGSRSFHATANATEGPLVTHGPFRFVRNPIYLAAILILAGGVASHPSLLHAGLLAAVVALLLVRIFSEERELLLAYPEYAAYAARTKRLVPYVF